MAEYCSCGAELPPDALFCHKCGKPQREIVVPETVEPPAAVMAPTPPVSISMDVPPPTFRNPVAIKIALFVAGIGTLLSFLPYVNFFGAGFFAVFFYRRRMGRPLNLESGVRMGWMTGLIMFSFLALILMAWVLLMRAAGGMAVIPPQLRESVDPKVIDGLQQLIQSGPKVAGALIELFVFTTLLSMAGGALGAKMVGRS
jgi:hypothetical protein